MIFLLLLEETEQGKFMKRLAAIDKDWPDCPDTELRRLLEVPWLFDFIPGPDIISPMFSQAEQGESLIFTDGQSNIDDTALLLHRSEDGVNHHILCAPINRANLLLSAAAEGRVVLQGE